MKKVFVAGHNGMAGSAICHTIGQRYKCHVITQPKALLDLTDPVATLKFIQNVQPDELILAAAKVGGIAANNNHRVEFLLQNLKIQNNVIGAAFETGIKNLIFLGSSCIYPKNAQCPIKETELLTGSLEYTNEPYAIAKIAGMKLCENISKENDDFSYLTIMPSNLYGPRDNYDLTTGHVFAVACLKITLGKLLSENDAENAFQLFRMTQRLEPDVTIDKEKIMDILKRHGITKEKIEFWGTGTPLREFLSTEDLSEAVCAISRDYQKSKAILANQNFSVNCGSGQNVSISKLVSTISSIIGYDGKIVFNGQNSDGTFQKDIDSSTLRQLGWKPKTVITQGIKNTIKELYLKCGK